MHKAMLLTAAAALVLGAPASAQQPDGDPSSAVPDALHALGPEVVAAVNGAAVIIVRTPRFEARLRAPRIDGRQLHYASGDIRRGQISADDLPNPIEVSEISRVEAFRPNTVLAGLIGAGTGFLVGALIVQSYERQRLSDCTDHDDFTPCPPPLTADDKRTAMIASVAVMVPTAILTDRLRFAWRTVYRAPPR